KRQLDPSLRWDDGIGRPGILRRPVCHQAPTHRHPTSGTRFPQPFQYLPASRLREGSAAARHPFGLSALAAPPMIDAPNDTTAVRFDAVRLDRGGRTIVSGIDLSVPRGSVTAVLGPSGSGKSTLLAALTG